MKKITFLIFILISFFILQVQATRIETNCTGQSGSIDANGDDYINGLTRIWHINTGVNDKPVLIECNMDTELSDILYIYSVDNSGNEYLVASREGLVGGVYGTLSPEYISTGLPTGKAKVVFSTNGTLCGDPNDGGYFGVESYYTVDNSYTGTVSSASYSNDAIMEKAAVLGDFTIGRNAGRFNFLTKSTTSGYGVTHTIDNTDYKINITSSNLKVSMGAHVVGGDVFKVLKGVNYAFGNGLNSLTSGICNFGFNGLSSTTTGSNNIAIGLRSMNANTTGSQNTALGQNSLYANTTGSHNIALGQNSLFGNTTGSYNIGIGYASGRYAGGSTTNVSGVNSVFLGGNTRAQADGQTNQTVIGYGAVGNGSNSVTLGSDAVTKTILKGNVGIGTATPEYKLDVEGYMRVREIYVCPDNGCDYVFEDNYKLMNLNDLSNFIKTNKHLPEVAPAVQMTAEGIGLTEMNLLLLKKIEELTLYMIELKSEIETLKKQEAKP